jgi:uncharacterized membrane protein YqgA involved in biofilm formation
MNNRLYRFANKALAAALIASILGVGVFAVSLTRVSASITLTFGQQPKQFAEAVTASDLQQFAAIPVPQHKPTAIK